MQLQNPSLPSIRQRLTRLVFFRPERAILATLCAGVLVGQGVRAVLPLRTGPAPASGRPVEVTPSRPPRDPAKSHVPQQHRSDSH